MLKIYRPHPPHFANKGSVWPEILEDLTVAAENCEFTLVSGYQCSA